MMATQTRAAAATGRKHTVIHPRKQRWAISTFDPPMGQVTTKDVVDYLRGVFAPDTKGKPRGDKIHEGTGDT